MCEKQKWKITYLVETFECVNTHHYVFNADYIKNVFKNLPIQKIANSGLISLKATKSCEDFHRSNKLKKRLKWDCHDTGNRLCACSSRVKCMRKRWMHVCWRRRSVIMFLISDRNFYWVKVIAASNECLLLRFIGKFRQKKPTAMEAKMTNTIITDSVQTQNEGKTRTQNYRER